MRNRSTFEYIDRYLRDELSDLERFAFESRLDNESELRGMVDEQKYANHMLLENRLLRLKNRMQKDIQAGTADKIIKQRQFYRKLWTGLGTLSLLIVIAILWNFKRDYSSADTMELKNGIDKKNNFIKDTLVSKYYTSIDTTQKYFEDTVVKVNNEDVEQNKKVTLSNSELQLPIERNELVNIKEEENVNLDKENKCANTSIIIDRRTTDINQNKEVGVIELTTNQGALDFSIDGGTPPYKCVLYKAGIKVTESIVNDSIRFQHLEGGNYNVIVTDKNGCKGIADKFLIKENLSNDK